MKMRIKNILLLVSFILTGFAAQAQYCTARGADNCGGCAKGGSDCTFDNFYVSRFEVTGSGINHSSGADQCGANGMGYSDYTSVVGVLEPNTTYDVTLVNGGPSRSIYMVANVYVDFDGSNSFDQNETFALSTTDGVNMTGTIVVPDSALLDPDKVTRLRVVYDYLTADPCYGSSNYGEAEDYTIHLFRPQCSVSPDAGADKTICNGEAVTIGGSPASSGGTQPHKYSWSPTTGLSNPNIANPVANPSTTTTYTLTVTDDNGNGCSASDVVVVTVNSLPAKPDFTFAPDDTVCAPEVITLSSDDATAYQWFLNGNEIVGATSKTYDVTESGSYTVRIEDANGCQNTSDAQEFVVYPKANPDVKDGGATTVCNPDSVHLFVDNANPAWDYQWKLDGAPIAGATEDDIYIKTSGDYHVVVSYGGYCADSSAPIAVSVEGNLSQPEVIGNPGLAICSNANPAETELVASVNAPKYQWYKDGVAIPNTDQHSIIVNVTGFYQVEIFSSTCQSISDSVEVINSTPFKPTINPISANPKCPEDTVYLESSPGQGFQWLFEGSPIANADDTIFAAVEQGEYQVVTFNEFGCSDTSNPYLVSNFAGSDPLIIAPDGPTIFCEGDSVRLFAQGATNYQWFKDNVAIAGATEESYLALSSGFFHVTYTDQNGCNSTADSIQVIVNPGPTKPVITSNGGSQVCFPDSILLSTDANYHAYQWLFNGDSIAGATTNSYYAKAGGAYEVIVSNQDGCHAISDKFFTTIVLETKPVIRYFGDGSVCAGDSLRLQSNYNTGNQWYRDGAAIAGATGKNYYAKVSGQYHLVVTEGNCDRSSDTITVTANANPAKPDITPNQDAIICRGDSIIFSTTAVGNITWFKDGEFIDGEHGDTLIAKSTGDYFFEIADANNCTEFSDTVNVIVRFEDPLAISPSDTVICDNATIELASNAEFGNQWFFNGNPISGATGQYYYANAAGSYHVEATQDNCSDVSQPITITHIASPGITPTITVNGPTIFCNGDQTELIAGNTGGMDVQWVLDGEAIEGATNNNYIASKGGEYQVVIYNAAGCTDSSATTAILNFPEIVIEDPVIVDNTCPGSFDGSITVQATGGGGSFTYSLDGAPYTFSGYFDGLEAGIYWVYVKDNNNCLDSVEAVVGEQGTDLYVYATLDNNITCNNENNAQITATGTGGAGELEYSINGGQTWTTNEVFSGLPGGIYTVMVRDTNGCLYESSPPIEISNPAFLDLQVQVEQDITCTDDNDGKILAMASGGFGFKQFKLNNGPWINSASAYTFDNLSEGVYTVKVKDERGCIRVKENIYITNPDPLVVEEVFLDSPISCNGAADAIIEVQVSGGGGFYEYSLNPPNYQRSNRFSNLGPGAHTVRVRDARGCVVTAAPIFISQPSRINVSASVINHVDCFGKPTGRIAVQGSGGKGTLAFSVDGSIYMLADTIDGLRADTYTIYAMDENGCVGTALNQVTISQPDAINLNIQAQDVSCFDAYDGSITINASGGTGNFEYSIGGTFYQSGNQFTGLQGGTYRVYVRDNSGCVVNRTVIIDEPSELQFSATAVDVKCFGQADGQIIALASGGTSPYEYSYNGGATYVANPVKTNVGPGVYSVFVRDANGCVKSAQAIVKQPNAPLTISHSKKNVTCNGATDGFIQIHASGGTGVLEYSLDNGTYQSDSTFMNLNPGFYIIHVRDENGCVESETVNITQPAELIADLQVQNGVSCNGANDASLVASATGGTSPYKYTLDLNFPFTSANTFANLADGDYKVYVKDANGCIDSSEIVSLSQPQAISITASLVQGISCNGANDASIVANASGGTGSLSYSINGSTPQSSPSFTGLGAGNYVVTVYDVNNCNESSNLISISEPSKLNLIGGVDRNVTCFGGNDGAIILSASGGVPPLQYSINGLDFFSSPNFNKVVAGNYAPVVIDANGCMTQLSSNLIVTQPDEIDITAVITDEMAGNDGAIDLTVTGGVFPYLYQWNFGQTTQDLSGIEGGQSYTVQVTDNAGCEKTATFFVPTHVGLEELAEMGLITLYPNPTNGVFTLAFAQNSGLVNVNWTLMNMIGEVVDQGEQYVHSNGTTVEFDYSSLAKGVYHLILREDTSVLDFKVIIQ